MCDKQTDDSTNNADSSTTNVSSNSASTTDVSSNSANSIKDKAILLQTAKAMACNIDETRKAGVRILFDNGSQRSYVTDSLVQRLKLSVSRKEKLHLDTFGDDHFKARQCEVVKFKLIKPGMKDHVLIEALRFPTICTPLPPVMKLDDYPCMKELELADDLTNQSTAIDILIGSDYYWALVTGEVLRTDGGPTAVRSKLGWLLSGPIQGSHNLVTVTNLAISQGIHYPLTTSEDDALLCTLKCFWQLESLGITDAPVSNEGIDTFLRNLQFTGSRYTVNLPWRLDTQELPSRVPID